MGPLVRHTSVCTACVQVGSYIHVYSDAFDESCFCATEKAPSTVECNPVPSGCVLNQSLRWPRRATFAYRAPRAAHRVPRTAHGAPHIVHCVEGRGCRRGN